MQEEFNGALKFIILTMAHEGVTDWVIVNYFILFPFLIDHVPGYSILKFFILCKVTLVGSKS